MIIFWLVLFIALIILELSTTQLICIWFAGGALSAFICALFGLDTAIQAVVFVLVSLIFLISTRKIVNKLKSKPNTKTNAESLIGESAVVTEDISNKDSKGSVKIRGLEWSARSAGSYDIPKEAYVTVKDIDGVKLIVEKAEIN